MVESQITEVMIGEAFLIGNRRAPREAPIRISILGGDGECPNPLTLRHNIVAEPSRLLVSISDIAAPALRPAKFSR